MESIDIIYLNHLLEPALFPFTHRREDKRAQTEGKGVVRMISGPFRKLHFAGWILSTIINTLIVLSDVKLHRMYLLIAVLVLQHATLLFFMLDYEALGREQWKKKEEALRKQFAEQQRAAPIQ